MNFEYDLWLTIISGSVRFEMLRWHKDDDEDCETKSAFGRPSVPWSAIPTGCIQSVPWSAMPTGCVQSVPWSAMPAGCVQSVPWSAMPTGCVQSVPWSAMPTGCVQSVPWSAMPAGCVQSVPWSAMPTGCVQSVPWSAMPAGCVQSVPWSAIPAGCVQSVSDCPMVCHAYRVCSVRLCPMVRHAYRVCSVSLWLSCCDGSTPKQASPSVPSIKPCLWHLKGTPAPLGELRVWAIFSRRDTPGTDHTTAWHALIGSLATSQRHRAGPQHCWRALQRPKETRFRPGELGSELLYQLAVCLPHTRVLAWTSWLPSLDSVCGTQ